MTTGGAALDDGEEDRQEDHRRRKALAEAHEAGLDVSEPALPLLEIDDGLEEMASCRKSGQ